MTRIARIVLTIALLAGISVAGVSTPANAAGYDGYCTDDAGVTVVVDFQDLGGGTVVRCAPGPVVPGFTGLDALNDAGIPLQGVQRWGDAFICRLYNRPAPDEDIPINGNPTYRERCIDTPPAAAYWSYWHAPNGGTWTYSQFGVKNRDAIRGGFEGWSFSLNATASTNPPPGIVPARPATPDPDPEQTDDPEDQPAGRTGDERGERADGGDDGSDRRTSRDPADRGPAAANDPLETTAPSIADARHTPGSTPGPTTPEATSSPGVVTGTTTPGDAGRSDTAQTTALQSAGAEQPGGMPLGTAVTAGLIVFLAAGAVTTALRRRRASQG